MPKATINNIQYDIPVTWKDVKYGEASQVIKYIGNKAQQLKELTGIPLDVLDKTNAKHVGQMFDLISFVDNLEVYEGQEVKEDYKDFDFGSLDYGTEQAVKKMFTSEDNGYEIAAKAIKIIKGIDINSEPFLEWIGTANFFLSKLIISIVVSPSLEKVSQAMNKCKQGSSDYKNLEALRLTLSLQEVQQSETQ